MRKIIFSIFFVFLIVSCQDDNLSGTETQYANPMEEISTIRGMLSVKLQSNIIRTIDNKTNELLIPTGNPQLDSHLRSIGAYKMRRVFPYAGKHEDLQIEEGLNAWYTIWHKEPETSVKSFATDNIFEIVEPVFNPVIEEYEITEAPITSTRSLSQSLFDDPGFSRQWNMYNEGKVGNYQSGKDLITSSIAGADINILPVWTEETGSPDIVIAVVDGGIDVYHEDLIDNLWINKNEIPGNGIDDDDNGFVDDIHGFNFVDTTGLIEPHDHGTHVAGVIAATNNNGKGISGIAGGDGTANSGVKLMSCQIFIANPNYNPNDPDSRRNLSSSTNQTAAAIVYGANNGALISQNSWGYDIGLTTPQVIKDAIAYFVKHAGKNHPNSLMKGGLVVFAASNDYTETKAYPAAEPNVVSVAAYAPDFAATWYTNYGDWIDIAAPGGSSKSGQKYPYVDGEMTSGIYSTIISKNGQSLYGYMQGTSMACPHVSGIAALIVSKYGSNDFSVEELKQRLLTGTKKINPNSYNSEKFHDKLGRGYIDTQIALSDFDDSVTPYDPIFLAEQIQQSYTSLSVAWKSASASNDGLIQSYVLYFSDKEITTSNYLDSKVNQVEITANFTNSDDILKKSLKNLNSGKTYYFAIKAFSRSGNSSNLVIYDGGISTLNNTAPTILSNIDLNKIINLAGNDMEEVIFKIEDKENHKWEYAITYKEQLFVEQSGNTVRIRIFANNFIAGNHTIELTATDEYGAYSSVNLNIEIGTDNPPRLANNARSINVDINNPKTISLNELVEDEDKNSLSYSQGRIKNDIAQIALHNDQLTITPKKVGESELSFYVTDKHNQKTELTVPVFVYKNEGIYSLYPTVASHTLYVKLGDIVNGNIQLKIRNIMGKLALDKTYNTNDIDSSKRTLLVNVSSLLPGKYELSIINNGKTYKESFIKE